MHSEPFHTSIIECAEKYSCERLYIRPNIPPKKLHAAIESYGNGITSQQVIVLIDDTLFGGSKEGILITEEKFATKALMKPSRLLFWKYLEELSIKKKKIYFNQQEVGELTQLSEKQLGPFIIALNKLIKDHNKSSETVEKTIIKADKINNQHELIITTPTEAVHKEPDALVSSQTPKDTEARKHNDEVTRTDINIKPEGKKPDSLEEYYEQQKIIKEKNEKLAKFTNFIYEVISKNKSKLLPAIGEKFGDISVAAAQNDQLVTKIAIYIYTLLPAVTRLALSEQAFVTFVLNNRTKILEKLIEEKTNDENEKFYTKILMAHKLSFDSTVEKLMSDESFRSYRGAENIIFFVLSKHISMVNKNLKLIPAVNKESDFQDAARLTQAATTALSIYCSHKIDDKHSSDIDEDTLYIIKSIPLIYYSTFIEVMKNVYSDYDEEKIKKAMILAMGMAFDQMKKDQSEVSREEIVIGCLRKYGVSEKTAIYLLEESNSIYDEWIDEVIRSSQNA